MEPTAIVNYLVSEDAYSVAAGSVFLICYLAPRVPWTKSLFKSVESQAYLALGLSILPGIGLALASHAPARRIIAIALTALLAGLTPAKAPSDKPAE